MYAVEFMVDNSQLSFVGEWLPLALSVVGKWPPFTLQPSKSVWDQRKRLPNELVFGAFMATVRRWKLPQYMHVMCHNHLSKIILHAEEMLDGQHQRVDIPAQA